ncbi:MAG: DUF2330 domain-containing protein [Deltaproteobacteria bacterium]|nr:DUF2330 domain-containing protein [Deltaproteobacteria bacterium]
MRRITPLAALPLLLAAPAWACPTVANGNPTPLSFDTAQVALVRQGTTTTFTVSINPQGDSDDFALVLPVPSLLARDEIRVLDGEVFARLNGYTGVLQMPDAGCVSAGGGMDGGGAESDGGGGGGSGVTVEAEYLVGDYEITILSATESGALFTWLNDHDYSLTPAVVPALEGYIAEGMYFMAARVSEGAAAADGAALPPLQVRYESAAFSIPLKLAALSSPGEQDMILYMMLDQSHTGLRGGIANYPEFTVPDQCIWGEQGVDDFEAFYESRFRPAWEAAGPAAWTVEWAGGWGDCSPCSGVSLSAEDIEALGFVGAPEQHYLTRVHMRYTTAGAVEDLMLYGSGIYEAQTTSYADANDNNAQCIEACPDSPGAAWVEANGYSDGGPDGGGGGAGGGGADGDGGADPDDDGGGAKGGCAAAGGAGGGLLGLLGALGLCLRRRRPTAAKKALD